MKNKIFYKGEKMKTFILVLFMAVTFSASPAKAHPLHGAYDATVLEMEEIYSIMGLIDLRWRFPQMLFTETPTSLFIILKDGGEYVFTSSARYRDERIGQARSFLLISSMSPMIIPSNVKGGLDYSALPLGTKILNPENGLIEERWDGREWLTSSERGNRDFRNPASRIGGGAQ